MFYQKSGLPQESEIVVCTVSKVNYHSVFVSLNDYANQSAMLHISEISPGRIRNINDFVKEGKVIVCKVLNIDEKKGHIDVSLRRVNENQRREKIDILKQEQKAEKIIEFVGKETKKDPKKIYDAVMKTVSKTHDYLHQAFNEVVVDEFDISTIKLDKKSLTLLDETIRQRIKPPEVIIKVKLHLETYASDGIEQIKTMLQSFVDLDPENISIHYLGAGSHHIELVGDEYEPLEKHFSAMKKTLEDKEKVIAYKLERV